MEGVGVGGDLLVAESLALVGGEEPFGTLLARGLDADLVAAFLGHINGPGEARRCGEVRGALLEVPLAELRHPLEFLHGAAFGSGLLGEKETGCGAADGKAPLAPPKGGSLEREFYNGAEGVGGDVGGEGEEGPVAVTGQFEFFVVGGAGETGGGDGLAEGGDPQTTVLRPLEDDEIYLAVVHHGVTPRQGLAPGGGVGTVDDLRVAVYPLTGLAERDGGIGMHGAVGAGTDIEHIGAAAGYGGDEGADDVVGGFPLVVELGIAPTYLRHVDSFPTPGTVGEGHLHIAEGGVVAEAVAYAAADEGSGLVAAHDVDEFLRIGGGHIAGGVEPDELDVAVARGEFLHLRHALGAEVFVEGDGAARGVGGGAVAAAGGGPVLELGIVEADAETFAVAGGGEFGHEVAVEGRGVADAESADVGAEHGEAFMVLGGDDDVLHPGVLGELHDGVGIELVGTEGGGLGHILVGGYAGLVVVHEPLGGTIVGTALPLAFHLGIETEMDEEGVVAGVE